MQKIEPLDGFETFPFTYNNIKKTVYRLGDEGRPSVLIMQELPGMTKHTLAFARRLHSDGYTVYLPLLFGKPNSPIEPFKNALRLCVQREFNFLAWHKPSPITDWLRALCRRMREASGQQVGAVGMCLTGRFVLSLMVEDALVAPVMTQPAHPKGQGSIESSATLGIPACDLEKAKKRAKDDDVSILGLRFENDPFCPPERFKSMEKHFGDHFVRYDIDASLYEEHGIREKAHAVLTIDYRDKPGHPTVTAYEKLLEFFGAKLVI